MAFAIKIDNRNNQFTVLQSNCTNDVKINDGSANVPEKSIELLYELCTFGVIFSEFNRLPMKAFRPLASSFGMILNRPAIYLQFGSKVK